LELYAENIGIKTLKQTEMKKGIKKTNLITQLHEDIPEAGCDEAGRGCLAGPVFAAAVILPPDFRHPMINDSKKLRLSERNALRKIIESHAISYSVSSADQMEIDKFNILNASILAMHRALDGLKQKPEFILVDGNKFKKYRDISHRCIIQGDGKFLNIASIWRGFISCILNTAGIKTRRMPPGITGKQ
jgi:ribonuclease HII